MKSVDLIIVGAGSMAASYVEVMKSLSYKFDVICRNTIKADKFKIKHKVNTSSGGIDKYLSDKNAKIKYAIVCVDIDNLFEVSLVLLKNGIKNILIEKPGGINKKQINSIYRYSKKFNANAYIAYNRRFYESIKSAIKIIKGDGGIRTCFFEFTEWSHIIENEDVPKIFKERLFLCNSSHILDLFLYFCGEPKTFNSSTTGSIGWHPNASAFSGSGITSKGILFSYIADWESAGRWNLELTTSKRRLYFSPLEKLHCMDRGSLDKYEIKPVNENDKLYKPGIYNMVRKFIENDHSDFCTIKDQSKHFNLYFKIANY